MEKLTHWKKTVDTDWIGTYVLPEGKPITVILTHVKQEVVKIRGVKSERVVAYFAKNEYFDKPLLMNSTNKSRLAKLSGTPYIERWSNLNIPVTLCQEMDKTPTGGKDWALRISQIAPRVEKEFLTPDNPKWIKAVERYAKTQKLDNIVKFYNLSKENEKLLIEQSIQFNTKENANN